jgi:hypothetical protein
LTTEHRHPRCIPLPTGGPVVAPVTTGGELAAARRALEVVAERAVTIADEAFGLGPVEPIDATLDRIAVGITAARKRERDLEAEVQRLLCWTVGAYVDGEMEPAHRTQFESHLITCEACQHEVVALGAVAERLSNMKERTDG